MFSETEITAMAQADHPSRDLWITRLQLIAYLKTNYNFHLPVFWGTILPTDSKKAKTVIKLPETQSAKTIWIRHWEKMTVINDTLDVTTQSQFKPTQPTLPTPPPVIDLPKDCVLPPI